ncbi:MAG TPA: hypothetical protein VE866_08395 [Candidatus Binatia bacterium]|nr:hypothetical protein [Candidatus Binatia bacterium]
MSKTSIRVEPTTDQEWQDAVDGAEFWLALDSARQYGLIETDIAVDVDRCEDLLRRGAERGIRPASLEQLCGKFVKGKR